MKQFIPILSLLLICACDSGSTKTPEQIQAEVEASQKKFAEERSRIELERKAQEEKLANQRSFISVRFVSVDDSMLTVELTNETMNDLDNISGSLQVFDNEDNYVTGTGLTLWIPGAIYLPAGESQIATKTLDMERPANKQKLLADAANLKYHFTMSRYQYAGEAEVNLDPPMNTESSPPSPDAIVKKANPEKVVEQANPEPCEGDQLAILTEPEHYPGSKCEHVSRNLDSETFKLEYIRMCRNNDNKNTAPSPVVSVQLASCKRDINRGGIVYQKQLCCRNEN